MSRGQSTQAFNTASSQNATNFGNAQSAEGAAQNDIGQYQNQLASFVSGNPYTAGGEVLMGTLRQEKESAVQLAKVNGQ